MSDEYYNKDGGLVMCVHAGPCECKKRRLRAQLEKAKKQHKALIHYQIKRQPFFK